jgi:hypothetical protein
MNLEILEANLKELISCINIANKYDTGKRYFFFYLCLTVIIFINLENFIKTCKIYCPPSIESFLLDFSMYETKVKPEAEKNVEEEEDEEE